jgi:predicted MFS family arabinose efflux permease
MRPSVDLRFLALGSILSLTQVIGWATTYFAPAVLARPIADDLGMSLPGALAGSSAFLVGMAATSRLLVPAYGRYGAGKLLAGGSLAMAVALGLLSAVTSPYLYFIAWALAGAAGAAALTTSAHALLAERAGAGAKRWIIAVMLVTGLAGSIGLPVTAWLLHLLGWRMTILVFAGLHLAVCLPLHLFAARGGTEVAVKEAADTAPRPDGATGRQHAAFLWLAAGVSMIGFVTWGFAIVIVEFLRARGSTLEEAVALATLIGIAQVAARLLEFVLAPRMRAVRKAVLATGLLSVSFVIAMAGGTVAAFAFVVLYGAAGGAMSVARATIPLEIFDPKAYGAMVSRLSVPMHLAFAAAPFVFGLALERFGALAAAGLAFTSCLAALGALVALDRATADISYEKARGFEKPRAEP